MNISIVLHSCNYFLKLDAKYNFSIDRKVMCLKRIFIFLPTFICEVCIFQKDRGQVISVFPAPFQSRYRVYRPATLSTSSRERSQPTSAILLLPEISSTEDLAPVSEELHESYPQSSTLINISFLKFRFIFYCRHCLFYYLSRIERNLTDNSE